MKRGEILEEDIKRYQQILEYVNLGSSIDEEGEEDPNAMPGGDPNAAGAAPGGDPNAMGGAPGGDPNAMGGDPNAMGGAPGGDPNAMGGDPNAAGAAPAATLMQVEKALKALTRRQTLMLWETPVQWKTLTQWVVKFQARMITLLTLMNSLMHRKKRASL